MILFKTINHAHCDNRRSRLPWLPLGEFNVDLRTIRRDLNERFSSLQLEKIGSLYHHMMIAAVSFLWILFSMIQFAATLSLAALVIALLTVGEYGFRVFDFFCIVGESNIGRAIFAAMCLGIVILSAIVKSAKRVPNRKKEV